MNIVITGISKGIGAALLQKFADEGHRVLAFSSTKEQQEAAWGNGVSIHTLDFFDFDIEKATETIAAQMGHVDVLVNNAGILINKPFEETTPQDWQKIFEVNLLGAVRMAQCVLPAMKKSQAGHIVNIGSMGGFQGSAKFPGLSAYSASKAALANFTECLAAELAQYNIHVNCLALGAVNTEMLKAAFPSYTAPVSPQDMATYIADFCIHQRTFFNGKIIPVAVNNP